MTRTDMIQEIALLGGEVCDADEMSNEELREQLAAYRAREDRRLERQAKTIA